MTDKESEILQHLCYIAITAPTKNDFVEMYQWTVTSMEQDTRSELNQALRIVYSMASQLYELSGDKEIIYRNQVMSYHVIPRWDSSPDRGVAWAVAYFRSAIEDLHRKGF